MNRFTRLFLAFVLVTFGFQFPSTSRGAEMEAFTGEKASWHGFDRYDFFMQDDLSLVPTTASASEGNGFKHQDGKGRRCIVVVPKTAAVGNPWSWQGCYWDHQPQSEVELLKRGFCIGYVEASEQLRPTRPGTRGTRSLPKNIICLRGQLSWV
jgi:hypothetical protein